MLKKDSEKIQDFFDNIEKFALEFQKIINNRYYGIIRVLIGDDIKYLEEFHKEVIKFVQDRNYQFLKFFVIDGPSLKEDIDRFLVDIEKFREGIFLWICSEYPIFIKFLKIFLYLPEFLVIPVFPYGRHLINDYFNFINKVREKNSQLFKEELKESKDFFFNKQTRPIDMLREKDAFLDYVIKNFNSNFKRLLDPTLKNINEYMPQIKINLESYAENIRPILKEYSIIFSESIEGKKSEEDFQKKIKFLEEKLKKQINDANEKNKIILNEINRKNEQLNEKNKEIKKEINNLIQLYKEVYNEELDKFIKGYIVLIKDIDSYNIEFTKFLRRLYHILTENNRNYLLRKDCFFLIAPNKYDNETRNKLKSFLATQLKAQYPYLSEFLLNCFKYNKYRRLEAHEIPYKLHYSSDKKIVYIPQKGNKSDLELNIDEILKTKNTYGFFIEAIGVCR